MHKTLQHLCDPSSAVEHINLVHVYIYLNNAALWNAKTYSTASMFTPTNI